MGERQWYVTPAMRSTYPGGMDVYRDHGGSQWLMPEFDPDNGGLQRRVGPLQYDERMLQQGCTPTGRSRGPAGYEQVQYDCPNRPWGVPTGVGALGGGGMFARLVVPAAVAIAIGAVVLFGAQQLLTSREGY